MIVRYTFGNLLRAEIRRALQSWYVYVIPLAIFAIMAIEISPDFPRSYTNKENIMSNVGYYCFGINFGSIVIVLPFLAAFIHSPTVADDIYGGILVYVIRRTTLKRYLWEKYIACTLIAAIAIMIGFLLFAIWTSVLYLPSNIALYPQQVLPLEDSRMYSSLYGHHGGVAFFATHLLQMSMFGAVWSGVGTIFASVFKQRFAAPIGALIIYHVAVFVAQKIGVELLDPSAMIVYFDGNVGFSFWQIMITQCTAIMLCGIVFVLYTTKKVAYE